MKKLEKINPTMCKILQILKDKMIADQENHIKELMIRKAKEDEELNEIKNMSLYDVYDKKGWASVYTLSELMSAKEESEKQNA